MTSRRRALHWIQWLALLGLTLPASAGLAAPDPTSSIRPEDTLPLPLRPVADVRLPGGTTRFDYQSLDPERHLLFIAHLGDSSVTVFNTETQSVVGEIAGISRAHGVLAVPALGRVYASAAGSNEVVVIDEADLRIIARIPVGRYPDGLAWAAESRKVYVSDLKGQTVSVIDTQTNTRLTAIPVGGEVGNTQYDPVSRHVFSNVQTRGEVVEIDPLTDRVVGRHKLAGADGNHGLLIDPSGRLMFVACEGNSILLMVDMRTMTVISSHEVGSVPDVLAFDPAIQLLYVATETGLVSVFRKEADSGLTLLGQGLLAPAAHSVAVDPASHRLYFPLRALDGHPMLRIMEPSPGLLITEPGKPAQ